MEKQKIQEVLRLKVLVDRQEKLIAAQKDLISSLKKALGYT
jgi:hypothetical protein